MTFLSGIAASVQEIVEEHASLSQKITVRLFPGVSPTRSHFSLSVEYDTKNHGQQSEFFESQKDRIGIIYE